MNNSAIFRPLTEEDWDDLYSRHLALDQPDGLVAFHWAAWPAGADDTEAGVWGIDRDGFLIGYASIAATPGLPGDYDMVLFVAEAHRRQGLGSRFLTYVCAEAASLGALRLSWPTTSLDGPGARFLRKRDFQVHHVEYLLVLEDWPAVPVVHLSRALTLRTYPRGKAISHFCRLTDESFAGLRWAQPYSRTEVEEQLHSADDLLFLAASNDLIGVAWLRHTADRATIEPLAVRPPYQGRGYGAQLLAGVLDQAKTRGARRVSIGAWEENVRALSLYRRFGFTDVGRTYYLARNL